MTTSSQPGLPPAIRNSILAVLVAAFVYNLLSKGDPALNLVLAGGLIATLGLDQNARKGD